MLACFYVGFMECWVLRSKVNFLFFYHFFVISHCIFADNLKHDRKCQLLILCRSDLQVAALLNFGNLGKLIILLVNIRQSCSAVEI